MNSASLNFDRLLKLRLVVARYGEMDIAKWWNTRGQLGRLGTAATRRGFPRTHYFAQARAAREFDKTILLSIIETGNIAASAPFLVR